MASPRMRSTARSAPGAVLPMPAGPSTSATPPAPPEARPRQPDQSLELALPARGAAHRGWFFGPAFVPLNVPARDAPARRLAKSSWCPPRCETAWPPSCSPGGSDLPGAPGAPGAERQRPAPHAGARWRPPGCRARRFERRLGTQNAAWYLADTPLGDLLIGYLELDDLGRAAPRLSRSHDDFDHWFKAGLAATPPVSTSAPANDSCGRELLCSWRAR